MTGAFIEFKVSDPGKLQPLIRFVERLREAKHVGVFPEEAEWESYFDAKSIAYFENLTAEEMKEWETDWKAAPVEQRHKDLSLWPHWDFGSFLDALRNGEFLISRVECSNQTAKLLFEPMAYPYGGSDCLVAIVEAFGHEPLRIDDGGGVRQYVKPARWQPKTKRGNH